MRFLYSKGVETVVHETSQQIKKIQQKNSAVSTYLVFECSETRYGIDVIHVAKIIENNEEKNTVFFDDQDISIVTPDGSNCGAGKNRMYVVIVRTHKMIKGICADIIHGIQNKEDLCEKIHIIKTDDLV